MDALLKADRVSFVAALGAGVVLGISGIYCYYKANKCVTQKLNRLSCTVDSLRRELEELKKSSGSKESSSKSPLRRLKPSSKVYTYASSLDDPDEEYFDFSDTEDVTQWASLNGSQEDLAAGRSVDDLLEELDAQLDLGASDKEALYNKCMAMKEEYGENAEFLWRLAKATHLFGIVLQSRKEMERRKELAFEACGYAKRAHELDEENAEVHKWCAITVGCVGDYVGTQERILNGFTFKEHVDRALALKSNDPTLHYMLGRWCYEIAMLSWLERKVASTLFSSPPEASLADAREHLTQAERLRPDWKENILYIAKTYIGEGDYTRAISLVDRALAIPLLTEDDQVIHTELQELESKYSTYRSSD